jgi:magnesium-protoporphyrin O-methyltransferase
MPALVGAAAARTRRILALSYPPDSWPFRAVARVVNLVSRLRRQEFRFFVHAPASIADVAAEHGLARTLHERSRFWEIATFERL